jgi:hypothetical protein
VSTSFACTESVYANSRSTGLPPTVSQAEGKAAERRIGLKRNTDLLEESIEASVTRRRIALLEIDLNLDRMLVVGAREAGERLLGLARIAISQDDQPAGRDLLGEHAVALDDSTETVSSSALSASRTCSALLAGESRAGE